MKKSRFGLQGTMMLGVLGVSLFTGGQASACGGEWIPAVEMMQQVDYRPQGVARAEKDLQGGKYAAAAGAIIRMMPHIKSLTAKESSSIVARAQHVLAVATVRSEGKLAIRREVPKFVQGSWLGTTPEQRRVNLEFAAATLRRVSELKDSDPQVQSELGEALAQLSGREAEAKTLLEKLADKDLIATPEGYAALARLRKSGGDQTGQVAALKRCQAMSEDPKICAGRGEVAFKS